MTIGGAIALYVYFTVWIESAGMLVIEGNNSARYEKDSTMLLTRWYNLLAFLWFAQFVIGCQHMVIAGAVAGWFFTRNKSQLGSPIGRAYGNLLRYHLGTVALGSFVIALVQFLRMLLKLLMVSLRETHGSGNVDGRVIGFLSSLLSPLPFSTKRLAFGAQSAESCDELPVRLLPVLFAVLRAIPAVPHPQCVHTDGDAR